jgi:integrase/recombinase XerD
MRREAKIIKHRSQSRIAVYFDKNAKLIARIKILEGALYSPTLKAWHLPDKEEYRKQFGLRLVEESLPSAEEIAGIEKFKRHLPSKRYSESTVKTYSEALKSFLIFYRKKPLDAISNDAVIAYHNDYILRYKLSASYQNQIVNAMKLFFTTIRDTKIEIDKIHRPKKAKLLPNVLSKEEVKTILEAHRNEKHKKMLSLIYSCGLRRGELLNLKPLDIDSKRGIVMIRQAKGKKDRIVPLSDKILVMLRDYYRS